MVAIVFPYKWQTHGNIAANLPQFAVLQRDYFAIFNIFATGGIAEDFH
jgi:hypothetical protein